MSKIYFYYYNIIPLIENNYAIAPKSDDDVYYIKNNRTKGTEYIIKYTEAGVKKYKRSIFYNCEDSGSSASDEDLEKLANEIISSDWYLDVDENGIVKSWVAFDSEGIAIKNERLIQERFDGIYHHLKEQCNIHEHIFSSLEEGLPIFSKKELDKKEAYKRICKGYMKVRAEMISTYFNIDLPETKRNIDKSLKIPFLFVPFLCMHSIKIHNNLCKYKQQAESIIWTQEYLETHLQNIGTQLQIETQCLFSWDDAPGNDSDRLLKFLKYGLKIEWVENAKIEKSDDGRAITITKENISLISKLNKKEKKVTLEISGVKTYEYILKEENGKINIYETQSQNTLYIEIKADRRNTLLKLWISKLSDIQNSIKFAFQALALIFVVLFNLNAAVRFIVNSFYDSFVKNFYRIVVPNDLFLFGWIVISFLIAGYVFAIIAKKETNLWLTGTNMDK